MVIVIAECYIGIVGLMDVVLIHVTEFQLVLHVRLILLIVEVLRNLTINAHYAPIAQ